ncbi:MAG: FAD-binding oxidoreductase [Acidobacteria bacterium]|nr:FAD-binding oxidoreductase [Acidobacteriota bacterium]
MTTDTSTTHRNETGAPCPGPLKRLKVVLGLLLGLRRHDLRAARTFLNTMYSGRPWPVRLLLFIGWFVRNAFVDIPNGLEDVSWEKPVSKTPIWLAEGNPLANYPFAENPEAQLPESSEVVVIGAGFTGAALAYHWSKRSTNEKLLVVFEMGDAASGSSGRNEGVVVMGRYYAYVHKTVSIHLEQTRPDLIGASRKALADEFATAYCKAAYVNADMLEQTIRTEGFECDYHRKGWVQALSLENQESLKDSTKLAQERNFRDWTAIAPEQVRELTGMHTEGMAGFSVAAATFHPAKWVWCLVRKALDSGRVNLYSRTRVSRVEDAGEFYRVHTDRGVIRARYVVNATESYTPLLHSQFHDVIRPCQTQAAFGAGAKNQLKPHVAASTARGFFGRHGDGMLFGSDATRVPDQEAGIIQPSRFITKFLLGLVPPLFGRSRIHMTHEWSGTVSYTPDEYPIVGLMDKKRQYIIAGMAGSGTGVSFNGAHHVVGLILGLDQVDYYPERYFSPNRFTARGEQ